MSRAKKIQKMMNSGPMPSQTTSIGPTQHGAPLGTRDFSLEIPAKPTNELKCLMDTKFHRQKSTFQEPLLFVRSKRVYACPCGARNDNVKGVVFWVPPPQKKGGCPKAARAQKECDTAPIRPCGLRANPPRRGPIIRADKIAIPWDGYQLSN